jgi:hypothetical protein
MKNRTKENIENKHSGGIGGGFLLGLLLGVLLTLLVTTKRGREILRELMDKVIEKLAAFDEARMKTAENQTSEEGNDYVKPDPENVKREIRYLEADSGEGRDKKGEDSVHAQVKKEASDKPQSSTDNTESKDSSDSQPEKGQVNGKSNGHHKLTPRLFFRKGNK